MTLYTSYVGRAYAAGYVWLCGRVARLGPGGWRYRRQYARLPPSRGVVRVMWAGGVLAVAATAAHYVLESANAPGPVTTATGMLGIVGFYVWVGLGVYGRERGQEIREDPVGHVRRDTLGR